MSQATWGWYDRRFAYLLLFIVMLFLALRLVRDHSRRLCLVMVLGLNPIMGNDIIFGQNDVFILAWIVFSKYFLTRGKLTGSLVMLGPACASKPTSWFLTPFYLLYLVPREGLSRGDDAKLVGLSLLRKTVPLTLVRALLLLPFAVWDLNALYDDVWRWSSGIAEIPGLIKG